MKKRNWLSAILTALMLVSLLTCFAFPAAAATSGTTGDCTWSLDGTVLTISGNGAMGDYELFGLMPPWGCITQVVIKNGVTTIGDYAFYACSDLPSITIPDSVTTIGDYAFCACEGLTSITIPDSVTTIGDEAFEGCTGLTSVSIGNSVTTIGVWAFGGCTGLTTIEFGNSITSIGKYAFSDCIGLTSIAIPDSLTTIGNNTFRNCTNLTKVYISNLTVWCMIDFGNNWMPHDHDLYLNGALLTDVIIPSGVEKIKFDAFYYCSKIKSVTIPKSVTSIGEYAFYNCGLLTDVYYGGTKEEWKQVFIGSNNEPFLRAEIHYTEPMSNPFGDVNETAYYYAPVLWAVEKGVTGGTSANTFSPSNTCSRAQIVTFLWRAAGCPEPQTSAMPFTDVPANAYYSKAVLWAVENGITGGTSATTFSPANPCTRAQIVTFLWRANGKPAAASANSFKDVQSGAYYYDAVLWAVEKGITTGTSATTFNPAGTCTRAQCVTFLYRCYQ